MGMIAYNIIPKKYKIIPGGQHIYAKKKRECCVLLAIIFGLNIFFLIHLYNLFLFLSNILSFLKLIILLLT